MLQMQLKGFGWELWYCLTVSLVGIIRNPVFRRFFAGAYRTRSNGLPYSLRKSVHALYSCGGGMVTCIAQICFIRGFFTASVSAVYPALRSEAVAFDGNFRGCAFLSRIYIFTLYFARMMWYNKVNDAVCRTIRRQLAANCIHYYMEENFYEMHTLQFYYCGADILLS